MRVAAWSVGCLGLLIGCQATPAGPSEAKDRTRGAALDQSSQPGSCTYDSTTRTVTAPGDASLFATRNGQIRAGGDPCGDATVLNTDSIQVPSAGDPEQTAIDYAEYFLSSTFAPGFTPESEGLSEIEVFIRPGQQFRGVAMHVDQFLRGRDNFIVGTQGLNVNGDDDVDIMIDGRVRRWGFSLGPGKDTASVRGGNGTGSAVEMDVAIGGGPGSDAIFFGRSVDGFVEGQRGHDRILAGKQGRGRQYLAGGRGHDVIRGGGGRDLLLGEGGNDRLFGGPGLDRCRDSIGDQLHSCVSAASSR
jgi:Ca2+-binding RTX toxin-like protein